TEERGGIIDQDESAEQRGLGAGFESETERAAEAHELLHHVLLLVDLDRIDPARASLVAIVADRVVETAEERTQAAVEDVGEAHEDGQIEAAPLKIEHEVVQVHAGALGTGRSDLHVSR